MLLLFLRGFVIVLLLRFYSQPGNRKEVLSWQNVLFAGKVLILETMWAILIDVPITFGNPTWSLFAWRPPAGRRKCMFALPALSPAKWKELFPKRIGLSRKKSAWEGGLFVCFCLLLFVDIVRFHKKDTFFCWEKCYSIFAIECVSV